LNQNEYAQSATEYLTVLVSNPKDAVAHFYLGVDYRALAASASQALIAIVKKEGDARAARADQPTIDEILAARQAIEQDVVAKRDKAIEELANAVALEDERIAEQAQDALAKLYITRNNSLDGLELLIQQRKEQFR